MMYRWKKNLGIFPFIDLNCTTLPGMLIQLKSSKSYAINILGSLLLCVVYVVDTYMHVKAMLKVYKYGDILWPSLVYLLKLEAIWGNYFLSELCTFPISGHAFYYVINIFL